MSFSTSMSKPNSLCFGKISKFPVFSLTGILFWLFSLCSGDPVLISYGNLIAARKKCWQVFDVIGNIPHIEWIDTNKHVRY